MSQPNRVINTILLLMSDGSYRQLEEWTVGFDLVVDERDAAFFLESSSYNPRDCRVIKRNLRFVDKDSRECFSSKEDIKNYWRKKESILVKDELLLPV